MYDPNPRDRANADPRKHNYFRKLLKLQRKGKLRPGEAHLVDILHDDWCRIYLGGYCNCNPEIRLPAPPRPDRATTKPHTPPRPTPGAAHEETRPLEPPSRPCPHCGSKQFILWQTPNNPEKLAISCDGCGAVLSSTHPLDPEDRPMRRL
jgi:hypothetical protein